ncbi:class I SAM-dependent methyltransferase [Rhodococcus sp. X156]|uniref:methyltransferase domain-containing protein n=1 Tax=Rhodococcus sp. X156 TaxID=2499145 RepID=UPI000FDA4E1C|nr:class I SAM-dependent methyltransferase [Rhodococcus sp. X156]
MDPATEVAERLMSSAAGMFDLMAVALGDRLGYYRCLDGSPPLSSAELAAATDTGERGAREWLEQQAVTGLVELAASSAVAADRRYRLKPGVGQVLASADDLSYLAPLARQLVAAAAQVPAVAEAFRAGTGVPWSAFGTDMRESQADLNRPGFLGLLAQEWLATLPDVQLRLHSDPPARVADVGCGGGWSAIGLAQGLPGVQVDAFELDPASVELARRNVAEAGLDGRVRVWEQDVATVRAEAGYDLVTAFECLHDLPHPVPALAAMRALAAPSGAVLVADMKVASAFAPPGDLVERLMYGFSLSVCLPDSMSTPGSAATGTVMRESTMRDYARQAGFTSVDTLPVEHDLWRFYRLA